MPAAGLSYRNDGRILDFRGVFGWDHNTEPEDSWVMPHGMTWGEFKALRVPRPKGHGPRGQQHPESRTSLRRRRTKRKAE